MSNILTIIFRLTLSCVVAGIIMGSAFVFTNKAKKANEHAREERVVYALLGYSAVNPAPDSMAMHELFRYVVTEGDLQSIGYLLPVGEHGDDNGFSFVRIGLDGGFLDSTPVAIGRDSVREQGERDAAIQAALGADKTVRATDHTVVVTDHGQRNAYLISGKFPGFKTNIAIMLALNPDYSIIGLEIMEHEEDPGLGAEIERDYFKNQFKYKPFERIRAIEVVKEPLPDQYFQAMEGRLDPAAAVEIMQNYRDNDIYALTGATISAAAVSNGVRSMTRKFAYRIDLLDQVLQEQQIAVPF